MGTEQPQKTQASAVVPLDVILQVLGAGGAIIAWIVVVGGARLWARFEATQIPATQTLAALPKNLFLVEGLHILLLPLLVGASVALFVYFSRRAEETGRGTPALDRHGFVVVRRLGGTRSRSRSQRRGRNVRLLTPLATVSDYARLHSTGQVVALAVLTAVGLLLITLTVVRVQWWGVAGGFVAAACLSPPLNTTPMPRTRCGAICSDWATARRRGARRDAWLPSSTVPFRTLRSTGGARGTSPGPWAPLWSLRSRWRGRPTRIRGCAPSPPRTHRR